MTDLKAELKIPDLWYDFYARLLPGVLFIAALYILWPGTPSWPTASQTVILVATGYVCALVSQPLASELTWFIHWLVAGRKPHYVEGIARILSPREARILDKMHGEVTFFTQSFVLSIVLWVSQLVPRFGLEQERCPTIVAAVVFLLLAVLAASRRKRRADKGQALSRQT
jgi:peptidoglycan/LPS O-acetylase OafA/YrhL